MQKVQEVQEGWLRWYVGGFGGKVVAESAKIGVTIKFISCGWWWY